MHPQPASIRAYSNSWQLCKHQPCGRSRERLNDRTRRELWWIDPWIKTDWWGIEYPPELLRPIPQQRTRLEPSLSPHLFRLTQTVSQGSTEGHHCTILTSSVKIWNPHWQRLPMVPQKHSWHEIWIQLLLHIKNICSRELQPTATSGHPYISSGPRVEVYKCHDVKFHLCLSYVSLLLW